MSSFSYNKNSKNSSAFTSPSISIKSHSQYLQTCNWYLCFSIFMHQIFFFQKYFLCSYKLPIAIDSFFCLQVAKNLKWQAYHCFAKKKQNLFLPKFPEFIFPNTAWQTVTDRDTLSHALHGLLWVDECTCLTYNHQP